MGRDEGCSDGSSRDRHTSHRVAKPFAGAATLVVDARTAVGDAEEGTLEERTGRDEEPGQRALRFGHGRELALERLAGPPQQSLDGPDLDALVISDLLVGPPRFLAHGEDVAMTSGETIERPVHELAVDCREDELLGGVLAHDADGMLRGELQVVGRRAAGPTTQHVGADVAGDHGEPRVEAPLAGETRQRLPCSSKGFLSRVLRLVAVVQATKAEAKEPVVVARVEVPERGGIARLAALNECAVALQIDVVTETCQLILAKRHFPSLPAPLPASLGGCFTLLRPPAPPQKATLQQLNNPSCYF